MTTFNRNAGIGILIIGLTVVPPLLAGNDISQQPEQLNYEAKAVGKRKPKHYYRNMYTVHYRTYMGKVVHYVVVRKKDGHKRLVAYPYGQHLAGLGVEQKPISIDKFNRNMAKERRADRKRSKVINQEKRTGQALISATTTPATTGLSLGYNSSTGYVDNGNNCFNATTSLSGPQMNENYSSTGTSSSFSQQINISESLSGTYEAFKASENFTYSNNFSTTTQSGQTYFNASVLYTASSSLNTSSPLTQAGTSAANLNSFSTTCGSQFVDTLAVGMLVTGQFSWSTTSSSTQTAINTAISGSYGELDSITAAVGASWSQSNSSSTFGYSETVYGGGSAASDITQGLSSSSANQAESECFQGSAMGMSLSSVQAQCNTFIADVQSYANTAFTDFITQVVPAATSSGQYNGIYPFPYGVSGVTTAALAYENLPSDIQYSDILYPYVDQLNNYTEILNQITTLYNRAYFLNNQFSLVYQGATNYLNPTPALNLQTNYLQPLYEAYLQDYSEMVSNLTSCMNASSTNVTSVCQSVINLYNDGILNAFDFYDSNSPTVQTITTNTNLQQNTIALQYSGTNNTQNVYSSGGSIDTGCCNSNILVDVVWAPQVTLNPDAQMKGTYPYSYSTPNLIAFADQPWSSFTSSGTITNYSANTQLMPTNSGITGMNVPASSYVAQDCLLYNDSYTCSGPMNFYYTGAGCTMPTFSQYCVINGSIIFQTSPTNISQLLQLSPLDLW